MWPAFPTKSLQKRKNRGETCARRTRVGNSALMVSAVPGQPACPSSIPTKFACWSKLPWKAETFLLKAEHPRPQNDKDLKFLLPRPPPSNRSTATILRETVEETWKNHQEAVGRPRPLLSAVSSAQSCWLLSLGHTSYDGIKRSNPLSTEPGEGPRAGLQSHSFPPPGTLVQCTTGTTIQDVPALGSSGP